jgi:hypothetical protein
VTGLTSRRSMAPSTRMVCVPSHASLVCARAGATWPRLRRCAVLCLPVDLSDEWMDVDDKGVPVSISNFAYKFVAHKADKKKKK